jgi:hypothetical protein
MAIGSHAVWIPESTQEGILRGHRAAVELSPIWSIHHESGMLSPSPKVLEVPHLVNSQREFHSHYNRSHVTILDDVAKN